MDWDLVLVRAVAPFLPAADFFTRVIGPFLEAPFLAAALRLAEVVPFAVERADFFVDAVDFFAAVVFVPRLALVLAAPFLPAADFFADVDNADFLVVAPDFLVDPADFLVDAEAFRVEAVAFLADVLDFLVDAVLEAVARLALVFAAPFLPAVDFFADVLLRVDVVDFFAVDLRAAAPFLPAADFFAEVDSSFISFSAIMFHLLASEKAWNAIISIALRQELR